MRVVGCRLADARKYLTSCAIGLSGAVFGMIVIDNACSNAQSRSIFGMFTVPAKWYPWALLLFWQLLMPGVSFLGHLGGVLAGQAYVWGWLRWIMLSAPAYQVPPATLSETLLGPFCVSAAKVVNQAILSFPRHAPGAIENSCLGCISHSSLALRLHNICK